MIRSLTSRLPLLFVGFAALLLVMAFSGGAAVATEDSGKNDSQKFRKADDYGEKDDGYGCDDEDSDDSGKKWKKKYHSKDSHDSDSKWKKDCSKDSDSDDSDKKKWKKKYHSKDSHNSHWKKAKYSRHGGKHGGKHPVKHYSH